MRLIAGGGPRRGPAWSSSRRWSASPGGATPHRHRPGAARRPWLPADAERLSWTDWAGGRARARTPTSTRVLGGRASRLPRPGLRRRPDLDLGAGRVGGVLQERFGFSPATLDWELFSQSATGAVVLMGLPDDPTSTRSPTRSRRSGYTRPDDDDGVWERRRRPARRDRRRRLTPELPVPRPRRRRRTWCWPATARAYLPVASWTSDDEGGPDGVDDVVDGVRRRRCRPRSTPATTRARPWRWRRPTPTTRRRPTSWSTEAGEVNPLTGFAMAAQPDGDVRVALAFENDDQARTNADTPRRAGQRPGPGQGGDFADRFAVGSVTAEGTWSRWSWSRSRGPTSSRTSAAGPVLFATC